MIQIGDTFNRLTVIELDVEPPKKKKYAKDIGKWHKCQCSCESIIIVPEMSLLNKSNQSCGCLKSEIAKKQIIINREQMKKNGNTTRPISRTYNLTAYGETKSLTEWANTIGITKQALSKRLEKMSLEEAIDKGGKNKND